MPRLMIWLGLPLFDLVYLLGTMVLGVSSTWLWRPAGIVPQAAVGAIRAIFYFYFYCQHSTGRRPFRG
jgi:hypothetical protein